MAEIVSVAIAGIDPGIMGMGLVPAIAAAPAPAGCGAPGKKERDGVLSIRSVNIKRPWSHSMGALGNRAEKYKPDEPESSSGFGGPEEIRTLDPYNANVVRSQLRYRPGCNAAR